MPHNLSRFTTRIGKRVRRNVGTCDCATCRDVEKNGLVISDEQHANYLFDCQSNTDIFWEVVPWNEYRDTEDENEWLLKCDSCWEYSEMVESLEWPNVCELCRD